MEEKINKRTEYGAACFILLVKGGYLSERLLLAGDVRISQSIVRNYQHT